ncbi:MAG TPA: hypothetical protein VFR94_15490 [Nitrososphaeraceae archaeon]|nr:hypothetical protein [Nitrososphaeraceae archaeon]
MPQPDAVTNLDQSAANVENGLAQMALTSLHGNDSYDLTIVHR